MLCLLLENLNIIQIKAALLGYYNIFALKCGVCSIAAFTVNPRLSAVALIYFNVILVRRLFEVRRLFGVWRLVKTSASQF